MTFQPPPPPPPPPSGDPPPPPPPGQWGPTPGGGYPARQAFDPKSVNPLDWAILGLGALILIFSFFSYYTLSAGPISDSTGAWHFSHGSFIAWFAMVFAVAGAVVLALELIAPEVKLPRPSRDVSAGLLGIGSVLYILAIFIHPKFFDEGGFSFGHGFSFWLSLIMSLAATVLAVMRLQQTGGTLPGPLANLPNIGQRGPRGGIGRTSGPGMAPPPGQAPPPTYGPPPGQTPPAYGPPSEQAPPAYGPPPGQAAPPAYGPPPEQAPPAYGPPPEQAPPAYGPPPVP
jgi:hypothetical protein